MAIDNINLTVEQKAILMSNNTQLVEATDKKYLKNRVFVDEATLAPAIAGKPTLVEVQTFVTTNLVTNPLQFQAVYYYTGTNTASDTAIETYFVDRSGTVTPMMLQDVVVQTTQYVGSSATYAGLPTTRNDSSALVIGDRAALTKDVRGAGTKRSPQYPSSMRFWNGTTWTLGYKFDNEIDLDQIQDWSAATVVTTLQPNLSPDGELWRSNADRTTGAAWNTAEQVYWKQLTFNSNINIFADATTVAAIDVVNPTDAEIATFLTASSITDAMVYYTGTDLNTDIVTYIYYVDKAGSLLKLKEPVAGPGPVLVSTVAITADFALNETLNLSSGAASATGTATITLNGIDLTSTRLIFDVNGLTMVQGIDYTYDGINTITFISANMVMAAGDLITITEV